LLSHKKQKNSFPNKPYVTYIIVLVTQTQEEATYEQKIRYIFYAFITNK